MDKKAEAYQKDIGAAVAEMLIKVLPEVEGNVPGVMTKLFESMKETTGIDLGEIVKANTYDAKVTRNVNLSGIPSGETNVYVTPETKKETPQVKTVEVKEEVKPVEKTEKQPESNPTDKMSWEE